MGALTGTSIEETILHKVHEMAIEEAEPLIQKALADFEDILRKKVNNAALVVAEQCYDFERMSDRLVITIRTETKR